MSIRKAKLKIEVREAAGNRPVAGPSPVARGRKRGRPVRSIITLLGVLALALLVSGCWDRREINDLAIVSTVAVDREADLVVVTTEFFRPVALAQQGGGGAGGALVGRQSLLATGSGSTIFRAIEDIGTKISREVYWAHANHILVGEELTRQGIAELLDFWDRDPEARRSTHILLTRGPAKAVITKAHSGLEISLGREVMGLVRRAPQTGYGFVPTVHTVIEDLTGDSQATFLPFLILSRRNEPPLVGPGSESAPGHPVEPLVTWSARLYGTGLFLQDRLVAKLNPVETRGLMWTHGDIREAVVTVPCPGGQEKVDVEVTRVSPRVATTWHKGKPAGRVTIEAEGNLAAHAGPADLTREADIKSLERQTATVIKNEITAALQQARAAGTDVFGFAGALHRSDPQQWKKIKGRWPEEFKKLPVQVTVEFELRRTGLSGPGLQIGP